MKKTGFTLAEVLITLAIIGVVAALSLPTLSVSTQKAQIGPSLAKAVNTLETSVRTLLAQEESASLLTTCGDLDLMACLDQNGIISASRINDDEDVKAYVTKDGIEFIQQGDIKTMNNTKLNTNKYSDRYYDIYVDVNGPSKKPNTLDKDTFVFLVDTKGNVIPKGSQAFKEYRGANIKVSIDGKTYNFDTTDTWQDRCAKSVTLGMGGDKTNGYCTAAIIENGYKVTYDWDNISEPKDISTELKPGTNLKPETNLEDFYKPNTFN